MGLLSVPPSALRALLDAKSEEDLKALLAAHPGLHPYLGVVQPMLAALAALMAADSRTPMAGRHLVTVREISPYISGIIWDSGGKRSVEMVEIAEDALKSVLEVTPEALQCYIPATLQAGLHYPEYLTKQSTELLAVMLDDASMGAAARDRLAHFRNAVLICVEHGIDRDLMRAVAAKLRPAAKETPSA